MIVDVMLAFRSVVYPYVLAYIQLLREKRK